MIENFYHKIIIIREASLLANVDIQRNIQSDLFFNLKLFSGFDVVSTLIIFVDLSFYFIVLLSIIYFGTQYSKHSSHTLLITFGDLLRIFIEIIFLFLCFEFYYFTTSGPESFLKEGLSYFGGLYLITFFTQSIKLLILAFWLGLNRFLDSLVVDSFRTSKHHGLAEFSIIILLAIGFSFTMLSAGNLGLLFISLEGYSLILYVLASVGRLTGGVVSGVKYFAFGTIGSVFILWGIIHCYELTSSLAFSVVFFLFETAQEATLSSALLNKLDWIGALILLGFTIKLGTAPTHQWIPDVYSGVPLLITAFYSIIVKLTLFTIFVRLAFYLNFNFELEYAAFFSLVIGTFGTLRQTEIKRFLAYGSITHVGFLFSGDLVSSMIYLLSYLIASFIFFSVLLQLRLSGKELTYLSDLRFLGNSKKQIHRFAIVISLLSMAGLPPLAGFYGKMLVWASLVEDMYLFSDNVSVTIFFVNLILSLMVIFYYARLSILVYLGNGNIKVNSVRFFMDTFWRSSSFILNSKWPWNLFRRDILLAFSPKLFYLQSEYRSQLIISNSGVMPSWSHWNTLGYLKMRALDINFLTLTTMLSVILWTVLTPTLFSFCSFIAETL